MAGAPQLPDRLRCPWDRLPGDVENAVDVEQNGRHARRVYSAHVATPREAGHRPRKNNPAATGFFVTRSVTLPVGEIELRFSRSSGPGGQHAQRSETRVEALFDVESSSALTPIQKKRVISRAGPVLRAVAQDERSQWRNRELAVERLVEALRRALRVERPRRPTAPTAAAKERRLEQKRRRSETKRLRRSPT
jgi:ribosome-associated protein